MTFLAEKLGLLGITQLEQEEIGVNLNMIPMAT